MPDRLVVGTRGSALARWQARHVRELLRRFRPEVEVELRTVRTSGDRVLDVPLALVGGKGLFLKELEEALLSGVVDCAVHSLKDVPADLPPGCTLAAVLPRATPFDVLCLPGDRAPGRARGETSALAVLGELPAGARVGTSSLRRRTQLLHARRDLRVVPIRGNVDTRLEKLDAGEADAVVLAAAGLERLGREDRITARFDPDQMLPAVGQGIMVVEARAEDDAVLELLTDGLEDAGTRLAATCERAFLKESAGSCNVPMAAHAVLEAGEGIRIRGLLGDADGNVVRGEEAGDAKEADAVGRRLARSLLERGGRELLAAVDPEGIYGRQEAGGGDDAEEEPPDGVGAGGCE